MNTYRVNDDFIMVVGEGKKENSAIFSYLYDLSWNKKPTLNTLDYLKFNNMVICDFYKINNYDFSGKIYWAIEGGNTRNVWGVSIVDKKEYLEIIKNNKLKEIKPFKKVITYSDAGAVKIGNDSFQFNIPNGYGDGKMEVLISYTQVEAPKKAEFVMYIEGDFNIYSYDCSTGKVAHTFHGAYYVYSQRDVEADCGRVWFIKI